MIFLAVKVLVGVFILLINVKMPTIVGILTFMSRKNSCSVELSMKKVLQLQGQEEKTLEIDTGFVY